MKRFIAAIAMIALLGFAGFTHAADKPKPHKGHFVSADDKEITFKGGAKGTGKEHHVKFDDKTKFTVDGKDAKLADIKADEYIEVTEVDGVATEVAAMSVIPEPKKTTTTKPTTKPSTASNKPDSAKPDSSKTDKTDKSADK